MLRFRAAPRSRMTIVAEPSEEEVRSFLANSKDRAFANLELKRVMQALNVLQLPMLQKSLTDPIASNIISLRLRYKLLIDSVKGNETEDKTKQCLPLLSRFEFHERRNVELKHIRNALESSVNNILRNPKLYLCFDLLDISNTAADEFSTLQNRREKGLLLNIIETVGRAQHLGTAFTEISENFSWLHDQHQLYKLSDFALLITMHLKDIFHKLLDRYSDCNSYSLKVAVVTEMVPLASFVASLVQGVRCHPKFYRQNSDAVAPEQKNYALVLRFSNGS